MEKDAFRKCIIISSVLLFAALVVILGFCAVMFHWYELPNEHNTFLVSGTVTEVYSPSSRDSIIVVLENEEKLELVYPWGSQNLYSSIGYDDLQLADLLEGEKVTCRRMDHLSWAVKIHVGDTVIDNSKLTGHQMIVARVCIVVLGLLMVAFLIAGDVSYLKEQYKHCLKTKKKQARKEKRKLRKR